MPTIDIVIPVYNQADKIIHCLKSLARQTFQDFQLIIVDDGSTDNVNIVLRSWLQAQNLRSESPQNELSTKTKIITQVNLGAPAARNRGAREGSAEYLLFCDADVVLDPRYLEKTLGVLKIDSGASYCYTSFTYGWKKFRLNAFDAAKLRDMPYIHTTSLLRRRDFTGFDESLERLQDWDLWLTLLEKNCHGVWLPEYLFTVKTGGTMSRWLPKIFVRYFKKNKKVKSYFKAIDIVKKKHHLA